MTRQVEKSALDRIPAYLERIVDKMNREHDKLANDYMAVVRTLTSENKVEVRRLQNDIIIYLETATLSYETALMLTNDNVFYNTIARYPVVLETLVECACEAVRVYNNAHKVSLSYDFKKCPVFTLLDVIDDFPGLYLSEKWVH